MTATPDQLDAAAAALTALLTSLLEGCDAALHGHGLALADLAAEEVEVWSRAEAPEVVRLVAKAATLLTATLLIDLSRATNSDPFALLSQRVDPLHDRD
jgi:hypothetical protein